MVARKKLTGFKTITNPFRRMPTNESMVNRLTPVFNTVTNRNKLQSSTEAPIKFDAFMDMFHNKQMPKAEVANAAQRVEFTPDAFEWFRHYALIKIDACQGTSVLLNDFMQIAQHQAESADVTNPDDFEGMQDLFATMIASE